MDKEWGQAHPFELNTGKTIHCMDVNYMPTFQKRSALRVVFSQRVGNIPILSILSLYAKVYVLQCICTILLLGLWNSPNCFQVCPLGSSYLPSYARGVRTGLRELGPDLLGKLSTILCKGYEDRSEGTRSRPLG